MLSDGYRLPRGLVVPRRAESGGSVESIELEPEPDSVGLARDFIRSLLADRQDDTFLVELLTSELVSNVVSVPLKPSAPSDCPSIRSFRSLHWLSPFLVSLRSDPGTDCP